MSLVTRIALLICLAFSLSGLFGAHAQAHFTTDAGARLIHITKTKAEDGEAGLLIYLRIPGPLAYGNFLVRPQDQNNDQIPPFLKKEVIDGVPYFQLNQDSTRKKTAELADFLAKGYAFTINGEAIAGQARRAAFFSQAEHPDFVTPAGASKALADFQRQPDGTSDEPIYIVDALLDVEIFIPTDQPDSTLSIQSILPEIRLPPQITINNAAMDHRFDPPRTTQFTGQMLVPVQYDGSWLSSLGNFTWQGIWHIFIGLDHVLFVVCLALASGISTSILWSVTGFTLGHSVTLFLGNLGYSPQGAWFIPAVETAIALSILYAAILVLKRSPSEASSRTSIKRNLFLMAAFIGLIHGYGFSFVLGDLLGGGTNQLWLALIGFNIGVEIGQIAIVLAVFALLWITKKLNPVLPKGLAYISASIAIGLSLYWCWERTQSLTEALAL
ncbi:HupE/UreJ family protein [Cohaesibacter gelatinilyticus]|uniref:Hydrogenase/urease accessory protein HupE n=1 Tax=Cohaesibacter gelatinilyticus TaxID=372072 RepID=A0A285PGR7_9HYPH|nr:HupE/UreJ family protein [Cohaesibacter gelatinilyticus]SNZ20922.1 Hydrogenase/urease accessory protein HupE [Cohaesibacter gelatinilyticus]